MKQRFTVIRIDEKASSEIMTEEQLALNEVNGIIVGIDCQYPIDGLDACKNANVLTTNLLPIGHDIIEGLPALKAILRRGIGIDDVDIDCATAHNIMVVNIPDFCAEEVSNHVIAMILASAKKLPLLNALTHNGEWEKAHALLSPMAPIHGETLGIIGCGNSGRAVAHKAKELGMRILGYDKYVSNSQLADFGIEPVSFQQLIRDSDYITLHVGLVPETKHLIGAAELSAMRPNATLINTSRGKNIDQDALVYALLSGKIAAACLDVFDCEPIGNDDPLLKLSNVILTPHTASYSDSAFKLLREKAGEEYIRIARGERPLHLCNPEVWPHIHKQ